MLINHKLPVQFYLAPDDDFFHHSAAAEARDLKTTKTCHYFNFPISFICGVWPTDNTSNTRNQIRFADELFVVIQQTDDRIWLEIKQTNNILLWYLTDMQTNYFYWHEAKNLTCYLSIEFADVAIQRICSCLTWNQLRHQLYHTKHKRT